jgi:formylglycine-generating enzyme required for sulfatase activity
MPGIFLNYRRQDSQSEARAIYERLRAEFGPTNVFIDVDGLDFGVDFAESIERQLQNCQVLLALIGEGWLDAVDERGRRRLDDENDFVRIELRAALARNIRVVPVLLNGVPLPRTIDLPEDLRPLLRRQVLELDFRRFDGEMGRLISSLRRVVGDAQMPPAAPLAEAPSEPPQTPQLAPPPAPQPAPVKPPRSRTRAPAPPPDASPAITPKEPAWSVALGKIGSAIGVLAFVGYQLTWGPMKDWFGSPFQPKPVSIGIPIAVKPASGPQAMAPLIRFRDCESDACPWLIALPAGSFMMGSPATEPEREKDEGPQHRVQLKAFAVGQYEVTFAQWDACVAAGGCTTKPADEGWGRGQRPVINVSWNDAQQYVKWLSGKTGQIYRLLSEAEWEYAARAGTTTPFAFGDRISTDQANFNGNFTYNGSAKGEYRQKTLPVGSLAANAWKLHDVHGNVVEWVQDCWHSDYSGAPADGSPWTTGCAEDRRVLRGGGWDFDPRSTRSAIRNGYGAPDIRGNSTGFRLARTLLAP